MWGNKVGLAWGFFAPQGELKKTVQVYVSLAVYPVSPGSRTLTKAKTVRTSSADLNNGGPVVADGLRGGAVPGNLRRCKQARTRASCAAHW